MSCAATTSNLRWRLRAVVGVVLTAINQFDVIVGGHATTVTCVKSGLNCRRPRCQV